MLILLVILYLFDFAIIFNRCDFAVIPVQTGMVGTISAA